MHAARLTKSDRLKKVDALLQTCRELSTMDIIKGANVCAVNSIIAELRENGRGIECSRRGDIWYYKLLPSQTLPGMS